MRRQERGAVSATARLHDERSPLLLSSTPSGAKRRRERLGSTSASGGHVSATARGPVIAPHRMLALVDSRRAGRRLTAIGKKLAPACSAAPAHVRAQAGL